MSRRRSATLWALALVLVAAAFLGRLAYLDATPGYHLRHDAFDYDRHARSIALGLGYSKTLAHGRPTAFRPPGYPYFLAGVYRVAGVESADLTRRVDAARTAGVFVGTAIVVLIGLLAFQLWGPAAGLVALALGAAYVPLITVGGAVMSEPLFDVFMLGALCAALAHRRSSHRLRWVLAAGVLAGVAMLTRANAVVLLVPLAAAVWTGTPRWSSRALVGPGVLVGVALLVLVPWTIRNAVELHSFVPVSTQLGSALAGTYNDVSRADTQNPASWRSVKHVPEYAGLWRRVGQLPEPVLERLLRAEALDYAADHPLYVGEVGFWNTARLLDLTGLRRSRATAATITIDHTWADRTVVCFWVFGLLAVAGACTRRARATPRFVWVIPVLLILSVVFLTLETPRYRTPVDPFVVVLAALAVAAAGRSAVSAATRRRRSAPPAAAASAPSR